jgi:putative tricarboxylic transport membrane protein
VSEAAGAVTAAEGDSSAAVASASPVVPVVAGAVMVAAGVLLLTQVPAIRADGYGVQGPRFLPLVVISLWTLLSATYLAQAVVALLRRRGALPAERFDHLGRAGLLLLLLVGYAYAVDPLGYVATTTVFFVGASRALGSRHVVRDLVIGVLLPLGVYLSFTEGLNVRLPQGVMPF